MANKIANIYVCNKCDAQFSKWSGRCLECGAWGTVTEQLVDTGEKKVEIKAAPAKIISLDEVKSYRLARIKTGVFEIDRVLGGGLVPGSLVLISGEPGIGKSTLLAQIASLVARADGKNRVYYVSGEESASQVKSRLERLNCLEKNISFITETSAEKIIAAAQADKPSLLIIDSVQTIYSNQIPSEAGSLNQIRASTVSFLEFSKEYDIPMIMIGHITKDGQVAGPKSLEHIVDTVIYLESEPGHDYRILRAAKNRFGSVNEIGIFEMTSAGFVEVKNPSAVFIESTQGSIPGSVLSCVLEGTRPFLVEVQALVTKTAFGYPQRKSSGFDLNRLQVLCAVITKRAGINLMNQDVILNIVGGLKINDPVLDLAVCFAISSSILNQAINRDTVILGEVGLAGEVRNVGKLKERLTEAANMGIKNAIIPDFEIKGGNITLRKIKNLAEITKLIT